MNLPVFTKDGKTIYFTKQLSRGKKGKDRNDRTLVKIYKASLENDKWVNITELPLTVIITVQPTYFKSDEKTLYFVSDMPAL
jgi:hypothetical protein